MYSLYNGQFDVSAQTLYIYIYIYFSMRDAHAAMLFQPQINRPSHAVNVSLHTCASQAPSLRYLVRIHKKWNTSCTIAATSFVHLNYFCRNQTRRLHTRVTVEVSHAPTCRHPHASDGVDVVCSARQRGRINLSLQCIRIRWTRSGLLSCWRCDIIIHSTII